MRLNGLLALINGRSDWLYIGSPDCCRIGPYHHGHPPDNAVVTGIVHSILQQSRDFIPELDFIAEMEGRVVGQIVYSRGVVRSSLGEDREVIGFGPVSVLPAYQKQGIGGALITHTIRLARRLGYPAICIYGDPRYYSRFGFRCAERYEIKTADDKYAVALLALELKAGALQDMPGRFIESPAFAVDEDEFARYDAAFPFKEKHETDSQREFMLLASLRY